MEHPLGCHRPRISDRLVFETLIQVWVFGCVYWRIADESCSATTFRRRRDEWIEAGAMEALEELALEYYDRFIGLELADVPVDGCINKAPCGGEKAGKSPVDRGKRGIKHWRSRLAVLAVREPNPIIRNNLTIDPRINCF